MAKPKSSTPESSFDAAVLRADAAYALQALRDDAARAEALVNAWIAAGNAAAVHAAAEGGTGTARKAARRGLNVLKARGIAIPRVERVVTFGGKKEPETLEAWMLAPDGAGASLFVLAARSPASRYRALFAFLQPAIGVQQVSFGELSQSQLKESMQGSLRGGRYRPVPVPVEWARARIWEARKFQKERGIAEPLGFAGGENLLGEQFAPVSHPLDAEGLELADEDARELAKKSAALHGLAEFAGWLPSRAAVDELLAKLGETLTPDQKPDPGVFDESLKQAVAAATDRYFTPERRAELVLLMKDSALSVLAREGETRALEVVATMRAIEQCGLITDPPHEVPFLRGFFEKAVGILIAQGGGQLRVPIPRQPSA